MDESEKQKIKRVPIADILAACGLSPERSNGNILLYRCPWMEANEPALRVNTSNNRWSINGQYGTSSDTIELVQHLGKADGFIAACNWLLQFSDQSASVKHPTIAEIDEYLEHIDFEEIRI